MSEQYKKYLEYIENAGGSPLIEHFDEDWESIGPTVRRDMKKAKLVFEQNNQIFISDEEKTDE